MSARIDSQMFAAYYLHSLIDISKIRDTLGRENTNSLTDWGAQILAIESATSTQWHPTVSKLRLRHKATLIASVMRLINVIVAERNALGAVSEWEVRVLLGNLMGHLRILAGGRLTNNQYDTANNIVHNFNHTSTPQLFNNLMAVIA